MLTLTGTLSSSSVEESIPFQCSGFGLVYPLDVASCISSSFEAYLLPEVGRALEQAVMRREGRVRGKPSVRSTLAGRCRGRCRSDTAPGKTSRGRSHPVEKSREKRMGRNKRFVVDVGTNPALADFGLHLPLAQLRSGLERRGDEEWSSSSEEDEGAVQLSILVASVNSVIEAAYAKLHDGYGQDCEVEETAAMMVCTTYEFTNGAAMLVGDGTDIAAIESAFQRELGIFENAVEGARFSQFVRKIRGSTLSEESWSDVDPLEEEGPAEDDWLMVDVDDDGV